MWFLYWPGTRWHGRDGAGSGGGGGAVAVMQCGPILLFTTVLQFARLYKVERKCSLRSLSGYWNLTLLHFCPVYCNYFWDYSIKVIELLILLLNNQHIQQLKILFVFPVFLFVFSPLATAMLLSVFSMVAGSSIFLDRKIFFFLCKIFQKSNRIVIWQCTFNVITSFVTEVLLQYSVNHSFIKRSLISVVDYLEIDYSPHWLYSLWACKTNAWESLLKKEHVDTVCGH